MRSKNIFTAAALSSAILATLSGPASAAPGTPVASTTGTGSALFFPYYTVNSGWATTFNVMNTSGDTLAVKVRFHEKMNSRDVLDFTIIMSPFDTWTGWVQDTDQGPTLFTNDNTCTSPLNVDGARLSNFAYTGGFADTGPASLDRMNEGYVELLVMGKIPGTSTAIGRDAEHVNGTPRNCRAVDAKFVSTEPTWRDGDNPLAPQFNTGGGTTANLLAGSGNPEARDEFIALTPTTAAGGGDSPLKGNTTWLNVGTGAGAGTTALGINDWADDTVSYVASQAFPWFLEPTIASVNGLWTVNGVTAVNAAFTARRTTMNEWANNSATGAQVDWVITFPTKAYHVDRFNNQIQAAVSRYRNGNAAITGAAPTTIAPFQERFSGGDSLVDFTFEIYDREEREAAASNSTSISPAPPGTVESLKFETNVLQFGDTSVFQALNTTVVDAVGLLGGGTPNGWASVTFNSSLPMAAFAMKARTQGDSLTNFGQAMDNAFE